MDVNEVLPTVRITYLLPTTKDPALIVEVLVMPVEALR
jgi:hypothetical protein